jgi:hypothetical protein
MQLRADAFADRENAENDLVARGSRVVALVRGAGREAEPELAARVARCIERGLEGFSDEVVVSAIRLVANRRPPAGAAVLLDFFPDAPTSAIADELRATLRALAVAGGKVDPAVANALSDQIPEKRAIAGVCLLQPAARQHWPAVRKLLDDGDIHVRVAIADAWLGVGNKEAIPTLIAALADLSEREAWPVLERLYGLAGADGPAVQLGGDAQGRGKCRAAWTSWWRSHGEKLDVSHRAAPVARPERNHLTVHVEARATEGSVELTGEDGRPLWQLANLAYPLHAQVVGGGRVLVAEYGENRVSERTTRGDVVWRKDLDKPPVAAQRLADGRTFIACRNELLVVDAEGQSRFSRKFAHREISTAVARPKGEYVAFTQAGAILRIDASGKEVARFNAGGTLVLAAGVDIAENGRILVPLIDKDRVVEFAPDGTVLWQAAAPAPTTVQRLPNGNTLVGSSQSRQILEIDRMGTTVWKGDVSGHPVLVRRVPETVKRDAGTTGKVQ